MPYGVSLLLEVAGSLLLLWSLPGVGPQFSMNHYMKLVRGELMMSQEDTKQVIARFIKTSVQASHPTQKPLLK